MLRYPRTSDHHNRDFAISLFKSCYRKAVGEASLLAPEALVLFRKWKNDRTAEKAFIKLSADYEGVLDIREDAAKRDFRQLIDIDYFEEIDRAIMRALVREVSAKTVAPVDVLAYVRKRRQSHWYRTFEHVYQAIGYAAEFQQAMAQTALDVASLAEGVERYAKSWFRIDQLYRKFILHMQKSGQTTLMGDLFEQVENHYVNSYLMEAQLSERLPELAS
jgi:hypothetical protein